MSSNHIESRAPELSMLPFICRLSPPPGRCLPPPLTPSYASLLMSDALTSLLLLKTDQVPLQHPHTILLILIVGVTTAHLSFPKDKRQPEVLRVRATEMAQLLF